MKVEVRLFALLERYLPAHATGDAATLDVPLGTTVGDVIELLEIPSDLSCLTVVNGLDASPEQLLAPDDVLSMFPPLAGGA
jgi:molybdopterin converting factor small subunit